MTLKLDIDKIRRSMTSKNISQADIVRNSEIDQATIHRLLSGKQYSCYWEALYGISKTLSEPMETFVIDTK